MFFDSIGLLISGHKSRKLQASSGLYACEDGTLRGNPFAAILPLSFNFAEEKKHNSKNAIIMLIGLYAYV